MATFSAKGVGAALVVWLTYINSTFGPLFWLLLGLVFLDLILNVHQEGKQFHKIGASMATLGVPVFIAQHSQHITSPEFLKYLVATLCIAYIQVVFTELKVRAPKWFAAKNKVEQATIEEIISALEAREKAKAQHVVDEAKKDFVSAGQPIPDPTKKA